MSYQVLARKWRPRSFREMVGQEHVLKALINALDHNRLHHAYLFTGTRGVGKTTIARILAKCLNCETGVSSEPCNQCSACTEINEGRFVDLIEVDAASRTKVEDTRELLDNVQYAPTRGRYKVYLIDEVHMLSNSSFNALLKTLEEPPPHVKFLLATTDPQKLPVTVLSRCLQFSLKNMSAERIVGHLQHILEQEMVPFEQAGLWQLGRAADGSMRDALSLTDQAIAFGNGKVTEKDVRSMLGTIDQSLVSRVLKALVTEDAQAVLGAVAELAEHSPDYHGVLAELIAVLHRIAIAQVVPEAIDNSLGDRQSIYELAQSMAPEDVQLYYQTALLGRRDLPLSPDPRGGFEMVLLRMLAFKPQGVAELPGKALTASKANSDQSQALQTAVEGLPEAIKKPEAPGAHRNSVQRQAPSPVAAVDASASLSGADAHPVDTSPAPVHWNHGEVLLADTADSIKSQSTDTAIDTLAAPSAQARVQPVTNTQQALKQPIDKTAQEPINTEPAGPLASTAKKHKALSIEQLTTDNWLRVYQQLDTGGLLQSTVANSAYVQKVDNTLEFVLDEQQSTLYDVSHQQRMAELLSDYFQQTLTDSIRLGPPVVETPQKTLARCWRALQQKSYPALENDPVVRQLQDIFGAQIIQDSIKPIDPT
ncbi:MAG: DNA polymerase III subunit gamma/tau [Pseudomonadota bacterium]